MAFNLRDRDLSFVDANGVRAVTAGTYRIFVGGGQPETNAPGNAVTVPISGKHLLPL